MPNPNYGNYDVNEEDYMGTEYEAPARRLRDDLIAASKLMSQQEARYTVKGYYTQQKSRIRAGNQRKALKKFEQSSLIIDFLHEQQDLLEGMMKSALDKYSMAHPVGKWARSITGIGPVTSAGLLAHIKIEKAPTVGHILRFGGQDPTCIWREGEVRPFNADLKVVIWHVGKAFVMQNKRPTCYYGWLYLLRKEYEARKNANKDYADQAQASLNTKNYRKDTVAKSFYKQGMLPPARIDARAQRWTRRIFLSHFHEALFYNNYKMAAPRPYAHDVLNHAHIIEPTNMHLIEGFEETLRKRGPMVTIAQYAEGWARELEYPSLDHALEALRRKKEIEEKDESNLASEADDDDDLGLKSNTANTDVEIKVEKPKRGPGRPRKVK